MSPKAIFMETTAIPASKTMGQIGEVLMRAGARRIVQDYNDSGSATAVSFTLLVNEMPVSYQLPARLEPVYNLLRSKRKGYVTDSDQTKIRAQSERVAWRQVLRWVEAQVAMVQTGMVAANEVFLPYVVDRTGKTLYQHFVEGGFKMLAAPAESEAQG